MGEVALCAGGAFSKRIEQWAANPVGGSLISAYVISYLLVLFYLMVIAGEHSVQGVLQATPN